MKIKTNLSIKFNLKSDPQIRQGLDFFKSSVNVFTIHHKEIGLTIIKAANIRNLKGPTLLPSLTIGL